jgi:hypothetical protein
MINGRNRFLFSALPLWFLCAVMVHASGTGLDSTAGIGEQITGTPLKSLEGKVHLELSHSPYLVNSDLVQGVNDELLVDAGVAIIVQSYSRILLRGNLRLQGQKDAPIIIRAQDSSLGWVGLHITNDNSSFMAEYVQIRDAFKNTLSGARGVMRHVHFFKNHYGLWVDKGDLVTIQDCNITQNRYGIAVVNGSVALQGGMVHNNDFGVFLENNGSVLTHKTDISNNIRTDQSQESLKAYELNRHIRNQIESGF